MLTGLTARQNTPAGCTAGGFGMHHRKRRDATSVEGHRPATGFTHSFGTGGTRQALRHRATRACICCMMVRLKKNVSKARNDFPAGREPNIPPGLSLLAMHTQHWQLRTKNAKQAHWTQSAPADCTALWPPLLLHQQGTPWWPLQDHTSPPGCTTWRDGSCWPAGGPALALNPVAACQRVCACCGRLGLVLWGVHHAA